MSTGRLPSTDGGIQPTVVDAKGDLLVGVAADSVSRLAVGNNGDMLVPDSSTSTGLRWQSNFAAGKNKIINGDFGIWQRGTSFSNPTDNTYTADRFTYYTNGSNTRTISQQTFTPGTAPVSGYEGTYFFRYNQSTAGSGATYNGIYHRIEDVRTFAGQTVTLSVWAKADSARTLSFAINRNYGSGGSSMEYSVVTDSNMSVTTGWTRFTYTFAMPSVSGKTIGSGSYVEIGIKFPLNVTQTCDLWGLQLEAGSTATAFQTATGTIQGELAACQRYYSKSYNLGTAPATVTTDGIVIVAQKTTLANVDAVGPMQWPVKMRTAPTVTIYSFNGVTARVSNINGTDLGANSGTTYGIGDQYGYIYNNSGGTIAPGGGGFMWHYVASAEL